MTTTTPAARPLTDTERRALRAIPADWAPTTEQVWRPSAFHVAGLHPAAENQILAGIDEADSSRGESPVGVTIQGYGGAGKTHLLGWVRGEIIRRGGYFFLADFSSGQPFWAEILEAFRDDLARPTDQQNQVTTLLARLAAVATLSQPDVDALTGRAPLHPDHLDRLLAALNRQHQHIVLKCQDTIRALALYASDDIKLQTIGMEYLSSEGLDLPEPGEAASWRFRRWARRDQEIVAEVSTVLAFTAPSVIAIDQVDSLILYAAKTMEASEGRAAHALEELAGGLMALRQQTNRTLCLVACLPVAWDLLRQGTVGTAADRYRKTLILNAIQDPAVARSIIAARFGVWYENVGFTPPYPTWPVTPEAFGTAVDRTPRELLQRINAHLETCLTSGMVSELTTFEPESVSAEQAPAPIPEPALAVEAAHPIDAWFEELRKDADVDSLLDPDVEDDVMPALLTAALDAWKREQGRAGAGFSCDPVPGARPAAFHARLRRVLDLDTEEEAHWTFRAIAARHHNAQIKRLRLALDASGIAAGGRERHLCVVRNPPWSAGVKTRQLRDDMADAGGVSRPVTRDDLVTFSALQTMLRRADPDLDGWLRLRRPASQTDLLSAALADAVPADAALADAVPADVPPAPPTTPAGPAPRAQPATAPGLSSPVAGMDAAPTVAGGPVWIVPPARVPPAENVPDAITVGRARDRSGRPITIPLDSFCRHTAIIGGSGSGKTVLLRRIVEEAALRGVSSIVLDTNNDLARLGDPWPPEHPAGWVDEADRQRAADYLDSTDVVVWTPGLQGGRPLSFQPLPDLTGLLDDEDEFRFASEAAVEALIPRAKVAGGSEKAQMGQAVLREALTYLTHRGQSGLDQLIELLSDLPPEASQLGPVAAGVAASMALMLRTATIIDPLFAGAGDPADPGTLLTPAPGKRARVSVISFVGLGLGDGPAGFVNRLQTNLVAWLKRNPKQGLGALLVMDEAQTFAPSRGTTPARNSTVTLAAQARKFGLGLIVATQGPKDVDNRVFSNSSTHFYGKLNSPSQIEAAKELARVKGATVDRIGRLERGQFYVSGEGVGFHEISAPLCLSYHPANPLTPAEVTARARRGSGG
jgi:DNA helicase HerA-like ATPase